MPRAKAGHFPDSSQVRRRVVRACQRCRLRKCKCDGLTPCTRCQTDDAICAYSRLQHSDRTVYRKGYVQMMEHQQTQLIAGIQEIYRRLILKEPWPGLPVEVSPHGQPSTHQILEALDILQPGESDDGFSDPLTTSGFHFVPLDSPPPTPASHSGSMHASRPPRGEADHGTQAQPSCGPMPPTPVLGKRSKKKPDLKLQMPLPYFPSLYDQQSHFPLLVTPTQGNWEFDLMTDLNALCSDPAPVGYRSGLETFGMETL